MKVYLLQGWVNLPVCLLFLCFAVSSVTFTNAAPLCPGSPDRECANYAELSVLEKPGAACSGLLKPDCTALNASASAFREAYQTWLSNGICNVTAMEKAANTISMSIADVWMNPLSNVTCEGQGYMCGFSVGSSEAWASRLEEDLAVAAVDAGMTLETRLFCYADVRALADRVNDAVNPTADDVCTIGGNGDDFKLKYVARVEKHILSTLKSSLGKKCQFPQRVLDASLCTRGTDRPGRVFKLGDICGGSTDMDPCSGRVRRKCCVASFTQGFCLCTKCNGPWRRRSSPTDALTVFSSLRGGRKCYCTNIRPRRQPLQEP